MTLSALGFTGMTLFVKRLSGTVPHFELVFFRSSVNFAIQLVFVLVLHEGIFPHARGLLVFRGLAGFGGVTCLFYAITHLPISVAAMLNWCSPAFVILFSALVLRERLSAWALAWIAVVFGGLILLLRPEWGGELPPFPVAVGVAGAAFGAMAYVAVRAATARVGVNVIILYFTGIATLLSAPLAWRDWSAPRDLATWGQLICVGLFASVGQFAMTQGYRFAQAGLVSTMGLLNAAFTAAFGWLLFDERLAGAQWVGMVIVAGGISVLTLGVKPRFATASQSRV
jgi:drug/metabolite transporter (DMT)-like permease